MKTRNFRKAFAAIVTMLLLVTWAQALSIVPPKAIYSPQEVLWFSVTHSNLIAVLGNGSVGVWSFSSGEMRNQFRLATNELAYPANNMAASRQKRVTLATMTDQATVIGDRCFSTVTGYDASGMRVNNFKVEIVSPSICGFVGATTTLILADTPPNNAVVAAVDTSTGKTLWRFETDDDVQTGTIALADGQCYVNFCRDGHLRARNQLGQLVWDWPVPKGKFAEPGYWPENPVLPYVVVYESDVEKDNVADLVALSAKEGKEIWRKKNARFGSLKAVSDDGLHQAFFQHGRVEITTLPENPKPKVVALRNDVDAAFSSDGRLLFCLPALVKVSENKPEHRYTVARRSQLLSVIDVETGRIVKQFSLTATVETP